eukprot:PhM_4_TR6231/c0_g1_i1/m.41572/K17362/ACOT13; acyl-coenzyme A thioesterase 13
MLRTAWLFNKSGAPHKIRPRLSSDDLRRNCIAFYDTVRRRSPIEFGIACIYLVHFDPTRDVHVPDGCEYIDFKFRVTDKATNPYATLHGGIYPVLGDAFSSTHMVAVDPKRLHVTVELSTRYVAAAPLGAEITARSRILRNGRQMVFSQVDFYHLDKLTATLMHTKAYVQDNLDITT